MTLIAEHHVTATPGRRVLEVYDADAYLGDKAAMAAARGWADCEMLRS